MYGCVVDNVLQVVWSVDVSSLYDRPLAVVHDITTSVLPVNVGAAGALGSEYTACVLDTPDVPYRFVEVTRNEYSVSAINTLCVYEFVFTFESSVIQLPVEIDITSTIYEVIVAPFASGTDHDRLIALGVTVEPKSAIASGGPNVSSFTVPLTPLVPPRLSEYNL